MGLFPLRSMNDPTSFGYRFSHRHESITPCTPSTTVRCCAQRRTAVLKPGVSAMRSPTLIPRFRACREQGLLNPSQEPTQQSLTGSKKVSSRIAGDQRHEGAINASDPTRHRLAHHHFKVAKTGSDSTSTSSTSRMSIVKTDLWQSANIAPWPYRSFLWGCSTIRWFVFADDFLPRFQALGAINQKLKEEMMATERYKTAAAKARDEGFALRVC